MSREENIAIWAFLLFASLYMGAHTSIWAGRGFATCPKERNRGYNLVFMSREAGEEPARSSNLEVKIANRGQE
jgi:hypothetical protein